MIWPHSSLLVLGDAAADFMSTAQWIAAATIVAIGLLGFGLFDLMRLSVSRIWAISGVCFRESIRRRVLWIIPLAIIGAVIVCQLQRAVDEQDAIRQTTKFCLFATGLVVVLSSIILACTNLPKEIETRVIYTVVTKPTTRLEIILGKILGFARVSGLILIIMGLFTYGYLTVRTWYQQREISTRLATDITLDPIERARLVHYSQTGLMTARALLSPVDVHVMAAIGDSNFGIPAPGDTLRGINGENEEEFRFPFTIDHSRMFANPSDPTMAGPDEGFGATGALIGFRLKWHRYGPPNDAAHKQAEAPPSPTVSVEVLDSTQYSLIQAQALMNPQYPMAKDAHTGALPLAEVNGTDIPMDQAKWIWIYVPPTQAMLFYQQPIVFVHVFGITRNVVYLADSSSVMMMVAPQRAAQAYSPPEPTQLPPPERRILMDARPDGQPAAPLVYGRRAAHGGQELTGMPAADVHAPVAVFRFRGDATDIEASTGMVPIEIDANIERGGDIEQESDAFTDLAITARPADSAATVRPINLLLESKQVAYAALPASVVASGNFDVLVRCNTPGHVVGMDTSSLNLIFATEAFGWNLVKSLFIMWMLTVLVVSLAIFASTFLSWPIAFVMTIVLLMGHWGVGQVADSTDATLGRSIATDMGLTDPSRAEVVATSVNALSSSLVLVGGVLPDIDHFSAIDDIQSGIIVSRAEVDEALGVLAVFALPAAVLAYLILKNKEVAP